MLACSCSLATVSSLTFYCADRSAEGVNPTATLLETKTGISRKAIDQLGYIKGLNSLVVLSGSRVSYPSALSIHRSPLLPRNPPNVVPTPFFFTTHKTHSSKERFVVRRPFELAQHLWSSKPRPRRFSSWGFFWRSTEGTDTNSNYGDDSCGGLSSESGRVYLEGWGGSRGQGELISMHFCYFFGFAHRKCPYNTMMIRKHHFLTLLVQ